MFNDFIPLSQLAYRTEMARSEYREKGTESAWRNYEDLYLALGCRAVYPGGVDCQVPDRVTVDDIAGHRGRMTRPASRPGGTARKRAVFLDK